MLVNYEGMPEENFWQYGLRPIKSDADSGQIAWVCVRGTLSGTQWVYRAERGEILARMCPDATKRR